MFGKNPIRPPETGDGQRLKVQHIFPTLQGEGPYTGWPSVFIRLGGCNLACSFCDTEFESFTERSIEEIAAEADRLSRESGDRTRHLIVLTGGEPFRQPIAPLCEALMAEGFKIQIETNGTLYRPIPESVDIICSPKNTGHGYFPIRLDLLQRVNALKFVVSKHVPEYSGIADVGQSQFNTPVYVQPMDEYDADKNMRNMAYALELATKHGYRLSLQTHKLLGIE